MIKEEDIIKGDEILFYNHEYGLIRASVSESRNSTLISNLELGNNIIPIEVDRYEVLAMSNYENGKKVNGLNGRLIVFDELGLEEAILKESKRH